MPPVPTTNARMPFAGSATRCGVWGAIGSARSPWACQMARRLAADAERSDHVVVGLEAGADDNVTKPFRHCPLGELRSELPGARDY
jgi:hypothetical protein